MRPGGVLPDEFGRWLEIQVIGGEVRTGYGVPAGRRVFLVVGNVTERKVRRGGEASHSCAIIAPGGYVEHLAGRCVGGLSIPSPNDGGS